MNRKPPFAPGRARAQIQKIDPVEVWAERLPEFGLHTKIVQIGQVNNCISNVERKLLLLTDELTILRQKLEAAIATSWSHDECRDAKQQFRGGEK